MQTKGCGMSLRYRVLLFFGQRPCSDLVIDRPILSKQVASLRYGYEHTHITHFQRWSWRSCDHISLEEKEEGRHCSRDRSGVPDISGRCKDLEQSISVSIWWMWWSYISIYLPVYHNWPGWVTHSEHASAFLNDHPKRTASVICP